jgi:hypothetical protein
LTRKDNHIVRIELAGYKPYETTLTRKVSGWVWGNIVFGGLVGLAVDAIDGALYNLTPEQVSAALLAGTAHIVPTRNGMYIAVVLAPSRDGRRWASCRPDIAACKARRPPYRMVAGACFDTCLLALPRRSSVTESA